MTSGVELWNRFVKDGVASANALEAGVFEIAAGDLNSESARLNMAALAHTAFSLATQSLLLGAEDVGKLALACERCLDHLAMQRVPADAVPILGSSARTLAQAFQTLANPDESGARTEGVPLEAARYELETMFGGRSTERAPFVAGVDVPATALIARRDRAVDAPAAEAKPTPAPDSTEAWVPTVDEDMIELFFEEANDRIEALSVKLLEIEQRPGDEELLRDIFRDLHTVKGSSAMVALEPMNRLAHAAEDLVGHLRDGTRTADGAVIDVLLATLDGLRDIVARASRRDSIAIDLDPLIRRLRDPTMAPDPTASMAIPIPVQTPAAGKPTPARQTSAARQTIRVDFDKLDKLMNLVGELVLGRDGLRSAISSLSSLGTELSSDRQLSRQMQTAARVYAAGENGSPGAASARSLLGELGEEMSRVERVLVDIFQDLDHSSGRLDSVSGELRESVMKLRMIPVGGVFRKHHRTVRDLSHSLRKRAKLVLRGEDTELDKLLVEALDEPLMHLVRNAVDHGIERPADRTTAGKPDEGIVELSARHRGNQVHIEIRDDGKGIDPDFMRRRARERDLCPAEELEAMDDKQVLDLIFRPGFSTAETISEVSGRGVGMDVVRQAIVSRLKGTIDIESIVGHGTTFTLRLPLTLAIIQVLLARTGGEVFAIPLDSVVTTTTCQVRDIQLIQDREVLAIRNRQVPLIRLNRVLELQATVHAAAEELHVVLTDMHGDPYGLVCENLLGKKEIVIKSLGDILKNVPCAAGATLLGDHCALILDVPQIVGRALRRKSTAAVAAAPPREFEPAATRESAPHILLVEDSDTVRESLRRLVAEAGYQCTTARDGVEGLELASSRTFDLISTDVMMPRMDGYELTRALRATPEYRDIPIVMVTSRGERIDRVRGFDAGVDEYITKPHDRHMLLRAIAKLLAARTPGDGQ